MKHIYQTTTTGRCENSRSTITNIVLDFGLLLPLRFAMNVPLKHHKSNFILSPQGLCFKLLKRGSCSKFSHVFSQVFSPSTFTQQKIYAIFFPPFLEAPCDEIEATLLKGFRQFGSAIIIHRKCQGRYSVLRIDLDKCPTKHLDFCLFIFNGLEQVPKHVFLKMVGLMVILVQFLSFVK